MGRLKDKGNASKTVDYDLMKIKFAEEGRDADEFIDAIARDVFVNLDDESKKYIFSHPSPTEHHFGMGMSIRNHYGLWGEQPEFLRGIHPDDLSSMIIERVSSYVIPNFDYTNPYYRSLYGNSVFSHLRRLYYALYDYYPDKILEKYEDELDDKSASKRAWDEVKNAVIDKARFESLCREYGISDKKKYDFGGMRIDNQSKKQKIWDNRTICYI